MLTDLINEDAVGNLADQLFDAGRGRDLPIADPNYKYSFLFEEIPPEDRLKLRVYSQF